MGGLALDAVDDETLVVTFNGEFDLAAASSLRAALKDADRKRRVVLDLRSATWLDSSALAVIVETNERVHGRGGRFALVRPRPSLWEMFELTGLDQLPAFDSVDAALASPMRREPDPGAR